MSIVYASARKTEDKELTTIRDRINGGRLAGRLSFPCLATRSWSVKGELWSQKVFSDQEIQDQEIFKTLRTPPPFLESRERVRRI